MSVHGCSFAVYADAFSRFSFTDTGYLCFRDVPDLLQKYGSGNVALDYGCGPGRSPTFLKKLGFLVDGVDINENMINSARRAVPEGSFQVLRENKIPADNGRYNLVFCSWVLQEIGRKHELVSTLLEITRVLKKDGIFVAIVPSETLYGKDWIHVNAEFEENRSLKSGDRARVLIKESNFILCPYFWTDVDYRDVFSEAGLDVILMHQPLGRDDEGFIWVNEKEVAAITIYIAKKKTDVVPKVNTESKY